MVHLNSIETSIAHYSPVPVESSLSNFQKLEACSKSAHNQNPTSRMSRPKDSNIFGMGPEPNQRVSWRCSREVSIMSLFDSERVEERLGRLGFKEGSVMEGRCE